MKRDLLSELQAWKDSSRRKPLILRGARQVGKSWLIREFAKQFDYFIEFNFETKKSQKEVFQGDLNVKTLLQRIHFVTNTPVVSGKTLLFLDEIQECTPAIEALRSFKEELPELHVIAAGSLIDFVLEKVGMPVGRVQFLYLHPLSFGEYLTATDKHYLRESIHLQSVDAFLHQTLLEEIKTYMWLGGMPEAINVWRHTHNINECLEVQDEIILSYKQDIPKYAKSNQVEFIEHTFDAIPRQLGNKFVFRNIDPEVRSYIVQQALLNLEKAGIALRVCHSDAQGLPLGAEMNSKRFKVYFFDIGLAQRLLGFQPQNWLVSPLSIKHIGSIAEQFVAQEYIAYTSIKKPAELYYWHREHKQSNAEVDFLFVKEGIIYPAEVKSSKKGHLKSLSIFLQTHTHSPFGLKISEAPFHKSDSLLSLPFYMLEAFVNSVLASL